MTTVAKLEDLMTYLETHFEVRYPLDAKKFRGNLYVFAVEKQEGRDTIPTLVDRLKHEFDLFKSMGGTIITFKNPPTLNSMPKLDIIKAEAIVTDKSGNALKTGYEYVEGSEIKREKPADAPKPAPVAIAGYDLVEDKEDAILLCARLIHATVEAMNKAHNEMTLSWEQSRESIIDGVKRTLENPGETAEQNHEAWMAYRAKEGWKYGPIKDAAAKTHPCMVPYAALGPFAQSKDAVFHAIVRTFFGV